MIELLNCDCMDFMATLPDKAFDLAIVDPPYGLGDKLSKGGGAHTKATVKFHHRYNKNGTNWDIAPTKEYFKELMRVSKNQIIWGGNYFNLGAVRCFIVWDKPEMRIPTMSDCEFAWTSFDKPAKLITISRGGGQQNEFHPTGKPVKLYKWLINKYAEDGFKLLDTHGGSFSHAIAAYDLGFDLTIMGIDEDYFKAGKERFDAHVAKYSPASEIPVTKKGELKLF